MDSRALFLPKHALICYELGGFWALWPRGYAHHRRLLSCSLQAPIHENGRALSPFSMQKMRVCVLLRCCFCCDLVPAARAVRETARRRRHTSCYVLVSTLSALFVGFVAVPVAADAPARAPAHCLHWWCCCGLCYAQLLYLLLQLKLLLMQQRFLQGGCLSSSLACLLCRSCSASLACCCWWCCCCCFISLKIRSDNK